MKEHHNSNIILFALLSFLFSFLSFSFYSLFYARQILDILLTFLCLTFSLLHLHSRSNLFMRSSSRSEESFWKKASSFSPHFLSATFQFQVERCLMVKVTELNLHQIRRRELFYLFYTSFPWSEKLEREREREVEK